MAYYQVKISFEQQDKPGDINSMRFSHTIKENTETKEKAIKEIKKHVNIKNLDNAGSPIYRDTENGEKQVGKVYNYWKEYSNRTQGTYNVWETAWVEIKEINSKNLQIEDTITQANA